MLKYFVNIGKRFGMTNPENMRDVRGSILMRDYLCDYFLHKKDMIYDLDVI